MNANRCARVCVCLCVSRSLVEEFAVLFVSMGGEQNSLENDEIIY